MVATDTIGRCHLSESLNIYMLSPKAARPGQILCNVKKDIFRHRTHLALRLHEPPQMRGRVRYAPWEDVFPSSVPSRDNGSRRRIFGVGLNAGGKWGGGNLYWLGTYARTMSTSGMVRPYHGVAPNRAQAFELVEDIAQPGLKRKKNWRHRPSGNAAGCGLASKAATAWVRSSSPTSTDITLPPVGRQPPTWRALRTTSGRQRRKKKNHSPVSDLLRGANRELAAGKGTNVQLALFREKTHGSTHGRQANSEIFTARRGKGEKSLADRRTTTWETISFLVFKRLELNFYFCGHIMVVLRMQMPKARYR